MGQFIGSIESLFPIRWRLWLGKRLFHPIENKIFRLSWHRALKGPCDPPEVEAMQYVAANSTVPVPKVYAVHTIDALIYIEMDWVRGSTLCRAWKDLTTAQKETIFADIKQHLSSLRKLPPPAPDIVSSAFQNPARDARIGQRFFGPMKQSEFLSLTRGHLIMEEVAPYLGEDVAKVHTTSYQTCFTHSDLAPRNIMVRGGRVVAIIDWEFAGWFPEYWEFTRAYYTSFTDEWLEFLGCVMPGYERELNVERILWRRLPLPGARCSYYDGKEHFYQPGTDPSAAWLNARAGREMKDLWSLALAWHGK